MLRDPVPVPQLEATGRIHFIAVGGAGMSGIARAYLARGWSVSGSDQADSAELQSLAAAGARVWVGHAADRMGAVDRVVISSAIREDNVELVAAQAQGAVIWHRSVALAALMADRISLSVAGTHGKTTTSGMLVVALTAAGLDPSYVIGSPLATTGQSAALAGGAHFVVEADESDGTFRQYPTNLAIVTSVEADHLDNWGSVEAYREGFHDFAAADRVEVVIAAADDPGAAALAARLRAEGRRVMTYGERPDASVQLDDVRLSGMTPSALVRGPDYTVPLRLRVPGRHNLHNAAAALSAAVAAGADPVAAAAGLGTFRGTARRFELVGQVGGITVVDDYAHHPSEITATLAAARTIGPQRIVALFQPHLYSRTRDFAAEFAAALAAADLVVVTDVYPAREAPLPGVTGQLIVDAAAGLPGVQPAVTYLADYTELPRHLAPKLRPGDLVLTLGAGSITTIGPRLVAQLEAA